MDPFIPILVFFLGIVAFFTVLRFLFQLTSVNLYNPVAAAIIKLTNVFLQPIRKLFPRHPKIDFASLSVVYAAQVLIKLLPQLGQEYSLLTVLIAALASSLIMTAWILKVGLGLSVIMSWLAPTTYSPVTEIARQLTEPLLRPVRRVLPTFEGFDFSPMVVMFILFAASNYVIPALLRTAG